MEKFFTESEKDNIEQIYGERSNFEEGVIFLERSIAKGFKKATPFLCIHLLKKRFGEDKTPAELYSESEKLKESSSLDDRVYFGVCLFVGVGISINKPIGQFLIDLASANYSEVGKYYQRVLFTPTSPNYYSILNLSIL
jgi:hypothetical protein